MKNWSIAVALMAFATNAFAQIKITNIKKAQDDDTVEATSTPKYDSLKNYLGNNVYQYIGQELYLTPVHKDLRKYGYQGFYTSTDDEYKSNGENVYKCCQHGNPIESIYEELAGKYFTVLGVIKHPKAYNDEYIENKYFLKLKEKESGDVCYYKYTESEYLFPFIVTSYYEKCKSRYIGKKYLTRGKNWVDDKEPMRDIETGKPVSIASGKIWECIDVTVEDQFYHLSLILKSNNGEKVAIALYQIDTGIWVSEKY